MLGRSAASAGMPVEQMSRLSMYNSILGGSVITAYVPADTHTHTPTVCLLFCQIQLKAIPFVCVQANEHHITIAELIQNVFNAPFCALTHQNKTNVCLPPKKEENSL